MRLLQPPFDSRSRTNQSQSYSQGHVSFLSHFNFFITPAYHTCGIYKFEKCVIHVLCYEVLGVGLKTWMSERFRRPFTASFRGFDHGSRPFTASFRGFDHGSRHRRILSQESWHSVYILYIAKWEIGSEDGRSNRLVVLARLRWTRFLTLRLDLSPISCQILTALKLQDSALLVPNMVNGLAGVTIWSFVNSGSF